ncbi:MAG: diheme cytochrome c-553 [bacterium]|nr:diheme cytochrome c-553 [Candidatus Kapabacteria bacterium]
MHRYRVTLDHVATFVLRMMICVFIAGGVLAGCSQKDEGAVADGDSTATTAVDATADADPIKKGEYLVNLGGCGDCHTPLAIGANGPAPDISKMLSGSPAGVTIPHIELPPPFMFAGTSTAFRGMWGVSYAANLTPDSATGIGTWTEANFIETLRSGKHMGGRPIMPPMPWQNIAKLPDADLKAMFAYLRSVPAINNKVPEYETPSGPPGGVPAAAPGATPPIGGPAGAPPNNIPPGGPIDTAKR